MQLTIPASGQEFKSCWIFIYFRLRKNPLSCYITIQLFFTHTYERNVDLSLYWLYNTIVYLVYGIPLANQSDNCFTGPFHFCLFSKLKNSAMIAHRKGQTTQEILTSQKRTRSVSLGPRQWTVITFQSKRRIMIIHDVIYRVAVFMCLRKHLTS